jgi:hypothetical protein
MFDLAPERKKQILQERITGLNEEGYVAELNAQTLEATGQDSSQAWALVQQVKQALNLHHKLLQQIG